jgi:hypothetical protein
VSGFPDVDPCRLRNERDRGGFRPSAADGSRKEQADHCKAVAGSLRQSLHLEERSQGSANSVVGVLSIVHLVRIRDSHAYLDSMESCGDYRPSGGRSLCRRLEPLGK